MKRYSLLILSSLIAVVLFQASCKENTLINAKISPSNNSIGVYKATLSCITHTYNDDTAITSLNIGNVPIYQGVGAVTDPYFGSISGATFFQIVPRDLTAAIYNNAVIDSAVLVLPYSGFTYGDTANQSATQTYQVFYMQDSMGLTTNYYNYSSKPIDAANPLSDPTTVNVFHLRDSFGTNALLGNAAGLRLKLKLATLMSKIRPALDALGGSTSPTSQDFINNFNGICVRVADSRQSGAAMPYFRLNGSDIFSEAGILVYYHLPATSADTALVEPYFFNTEVCAHFNNINRSYSHFPINNLFHSTQANDDIIALQNQPGASLDVIVPGIKSLPKGLINKVELQLTLLPGSTYNPTTFAAPEKLYPLGIGNGNYPFGITNGGTYFIADGVNDGYLHSFTSGSTTLQTFTVGLPQEMIASIAAKNDTLHLHINGTRDFYGAFHMVAGGGSYSDTLYRAKLIVVYSKLN